MILVPILRQFLFREVLDESTLQKRLLLCLYGLGTNTGLKRLSDETGDDNYQDLLYVKRRFVQKDQLRNAIAAIANAIFRTRMPHIWGEGTTACASDSKKFGAWDRAFNDPMAHSRLVDVA